MSDTLGGSGSPIGDSSEMPWYIKRKNRKRRRSDNPASDPVIWSEMDFYDRDVLIWNALRVEYELSPDRGWLALQAARDFSWQIGVDYDGLTDDIIGWAGDSNCSHFKPYDPADGHGFSYVEESVVGDPWEACFVVALRACGVPVDTLTGKEGWDDGGWEQCPYCGNLELVEYRKDHNCAMALPHKEQ